MFIPDCVWRWGKWSAVVAAVVPDRAKVGLCKAVRTSRTFSARAWHRGCGRRRPRSRGSLGPPGFARPLDQLEKSASLTGGSPVLVQKCKVPFLKFAEPFV